MTKLILQGQISVPDVDLANVIRALPKHISLTLSEPGCLIFQVTQNSANPNIFSVYEEFDSEEAFQAHQERVKHSEWGIVSKNAIRNYSVTKAP